MKNSAPSSIFNQFPLLNFCLLFIIPFFPTLLALLLVDHHRLIQVLLLLAPFTLFPNSNSPLSDTFFYHGI
jgi:hypothetical protein